jgi:carbamoylphosphate synthase small subunit
VRDAVSNWDAVVPALLDRARREAVGGVLDADTRELVERLRARADVAALLAAPTPAPAAAPVIDVSAQELRVEAFFPSDEATELAWA